MLCYQAYVSIVIDNSFARDRSSRTPKNFDSGIPNMTRTSKVLIAAAFAAFAVSAQAAPTLTVTFSDPIHNNLGPVGITLYGPSRENGVSTAAERFTGQASNLEGIEFSQLVVDDANNLMMYCYEISETVGPGWEVNYTVDYAGATDRTLDFLGAVNSVLDPNDPFAWLRPGDKETAAAIQLGIWESLYENSANPWSLDAGDLRVTFNEDSTVTAAVKDHLTEFFAALGATPLDIKYTMVLRASGVQDVITGDPIPLPGTLALLLAPAGLMALRRRTRNGEQN